MIERNLSNLHFRKKLKNLEPITSYMPYNSRIVWDLV